MVRMSNSVTGVPAEVRTPIGSTRLKLSINLVAVSYDSRHLEKRWPTMIGRSIQYTVTGRDINKSCGILYDSWVVRKWSNNTVAEIISDVEW